MNRTKYLLFILITLLFVSCSYGFSCVYAEETTYDTSIYYSAKDHITCYFDQELTQPVCIIPRSYFYKVKGKNELSIEIVYNNTTLYISNTDFTNKSSASTLTDISNPGYMLIDLQAPETRIVVYSPSDTTFSETNTYNVSDITFIGAYLDENTDIYYFFVNLTIPTLNTTGQFLIKADTVSTSFSYNNIPLNPASQEYKNQTQLEQTTIAQNKLKRNLFYFGISFLAVLIVILVYNPFKKKGAISAPTSHTSEDDF